MYRKTCLIRDFRTGQEVEDVFVLTQARQAASRNGPYWDLRLQDATGQIEGKIWSPLSSEYTDLRAEQVVRVRAQVRTFREQQQLVISDLTRIEESDVDWSDLLPSSDPPPQDLLQELQGLCRKELAHPGWKKLCREVLGDKPTRERLLAAPAAKVIHHAYRGGLLEHTLNVAQTCLAQCDLRPDLDRETLLVGAVVHDLGKAWELECGVAPEYTDSGRLLGHIILGLQVLEPIMSRTEELDSQLLLHLRHLILSHHGEFEYGSPKRPKTKEAFVLHFADNLDAKLNTVDAALEGKDEEESWSAYQRSLERKVYQASRTNDFQKGSDSSPRSAGRQCLLPLKE
ncbi:MAG: HD domain-containing protein [Desulfohalobiaceae bacterium]|nr:HD domain-containing protein [Desulfohalobiaceae bacterium]